jgi:UDP-N-acetylmuramoyl-tripeptide--D-alanyl-D-alanine ligase
MMTLSLAHQLLPGSTLLHQGLTAFEAGHVVIKRVHTDSRSLRPGDLFLALQGERFDAHEFLPQAKAVGAVAVIGARGVAESGLPGLLVDDTRAALGELAHNWRGRFEIPLIAVTGSNGKTTVTQMIASILRAWAGDAAHATQGNFNNDIGVPLTLLGLRQDAAHAHRCAVVELGMNHPGEIVDLARLAMPTVALVNNAQREHQEFMASVEAVARENGAVIEALGDEGTAVFPADDDYTPLWRELAAHRRVLTFSDRSETADADVRGAGTWLGDHWQVHASTPGDDLHFTLAIAGAHNVRNALAAVACALAAGVPLDAVERGLAAFAPVKGRSQVGRITLAGRAVTLVDDSYNANPDSVRAAIDMLAHLPAPRWLVLGDMGEVGAQGAAFHAEVGSHARAQGIEQVWTAGELCAHAAQAYGAAARHFASAADIALALQQPGAARPEAASILVKGSRFMKMEQVVAALQALADAAPAGGSHAA